MNHKCTKNHSFDFSTFPRMPQCLFVSLRLYNFKVVLCVFGFLHIMNVTAYPNFIQKFLVGVTFYHLKALTRWLTV